MAEPPRRRVESFFDGACPGNQFGEKGPMRAAYVVGGEEFVRDVPDLPTPDGPQRTNNIAEYQALISLLEHLRGLEAKTGRRGTYVICGDSQLVLRQMTGEYRVKEPRLAPLHERARKLASSLDVEWKWVPRERNKAGRLLE